MSGGKFFDKDIKISIEAIPSAINMGFLGLTLGFLLFLLNCTPSSRDSVSAGGGSVKLLAILIIK